MSSVVDICNIALGHLGSDNTIASISPPDGSVEAGYCARFYPVARRELLELLKPQFAKGRVLLAEVTNPSSVWTYAYALPAQMLRAVRVLSATSGLTIFQIPEVYPYRDTVPFNESASAPYEIEGQVLLTNEPEAVLLYIKDVVNTTQFTPSFEAALGYQLASYLAGPILRGTTGVNASEGYREKAARIGSASAMVDANSSQEVTNHVPDHLAVR